MKVRICQEMRERSGRSWSLFTAAVQMGNSSSSLSPQFLSLPGSSSLVAVVRRMIKSFFGDVGTLYKSGNTTVDLKLDTYSNVSTKVIALPYTKVACSFKIPFFLKFNFQDFNFQIIRKTLIFNLISKAPILMFNFQNSNSQLIFKTPISFKFNSKNFNS